MSNTLKNIYVCTTNTNGMKGFFKVGETQNVIGERIKQQNGRSTSERMTQITSAGVDTNFESENLDESNNRWFIKSHLTDNEIREQLCNEFGYIELRNNLCREWISKYNEDELEEIRKNFNSGDKFLTHIKDELIIDIRNVN